LKTTRARSKTLDLIPRIRALVKQLWRTCPNTGHILMGCILSALCLSAASSGLGSSIGAEMDLAELSLEELVNLEIATVYGASKHDQKVTQAPASVSIVTAEEIKQFGHRTLADAMRSVRGVTVSNDRNYSYVGMRGFMRPGDYNTRLLVLVDGHRMNDSVYDSSYVGHEMIDVDLIERVEIIRGPASALYGSSAFLGVVNIVTKRGREFGGGEVSAEGGSFDTYQGRFSFGEHFESGVDWLLSGSYYSSAGQRNLYYPEFDPRISSEPRAANRGRARNSDGENAFQVLSTTRLEKLTLSGFFSSREKEVPTASYGTMFNAGREETRDYRAYVDLKYDHSFHQESRLQGRVFFDHYSYYATYPYDYADPGDPPDMVFFKDETVANWAGTEWQLTQPILDRHTLILGSEYRENLRQYQSSYEDRTPPVFDVHDERTSRTLGVFAQAEVSLLSNLAFNTGLRYDHYFGSFGGTLNPRAALIYNPWEGAAVKLLYGEAFRAPNVYERYYYTAQRGLAGLKPETIRTYELAYEQYLGRRYRLGLSGYYYATDDLISLISTPDGGLAFVNVEGAEAIGAELELEAKLQSGVLMRASYALQRSQDSDGNELTSSPRHLAKLNVVGPLYPDKLIAGLEIQYQSSALTVRGGKAGDSVTVNLNLFSHQLVNGWDISAGIYNLFDTDIAYSGGEDHLQEVILQDGRSFRVKLTYRF
jgi:outer membrane receptor for ferrienterochelin and colicins